jgi:hypothetical protein
MYVDDQLIVVERRVLGTEIGHSICFN